MTDRNGPPRYKMTYEESGYGGGGMPGGRGSRRGRWGWGKTALLVGALGAAGAVTYRAVDPEGFRNFTTEAARTVRGTAGDIAGAFDQTEQEAGAGDRQAADVRQERPDRSETGERTQELAGAPDEAPAEEMRVAEDADESLQIALPEQYRSREGSPIELTLLIPAGVQQGRPVYHELGGSAVVYIAGDRAMVEIPLPESVTFGDQTYAVDRSTALLRIGDGEPMPITELIGQIQ